MPEHPLTVACIGAGYFARFHHEAWTRLPRAHLVAIADTDLAKARKSGLAPAYPDAATMLKAHTPDIVDIITPPSSHLSLIRTALAAHPAAIICQKPFCTTLEQAEQATDEAFAAGIPLIIHENFRFQPWYRAIRSALDQDRIGELQQMTFRLRPGDGQGPDAYLSRQPYFQTMPRFLIRETAVHWIDTFRYLLGPMEAVYADLRRLNPAITGEDAGHVLFTFADNRRALFDGNRHLDHPASNLRCTMGEALVEGTKGTLTLSGDGAVTLRRFSALTKEIILPPSTWSGFGGDCVGALQAHVIAALLDGTPLENTASDYLNVMRVEAAIYHSSETHQRVIL